MKLALIVIVIIILSCNNKEETKKNKLSDEIISIKAKRYADSIVNAIQKEAMFDTIGLSKSPVTVTSAKLVQEDYSNYKSIRLTYKNVSDKKIEAIKFKWYGEDAFGEPADMGSASIIEGFGGGFSDDPLSPGKSRTSEWAILSSRGKKVILAWAYEIVFTDGSKWKI